MSDKAYLDYLVKHKAYARQKLTKLGSQITAQLKSITSIEQEHSIETLLSIKKDLQKYNDEVLDMYLKLNFQDVTVYSKVKECDQYDAKVSKVLFLLKSNESGT